MTPTTVIQRLLSRCHVEGECLISDYSTGSHGYSQIGWRESGRDLVRLGHRVAWEAAHGAIPDGLTVDHLCRTRRCINPAHLRLLTNAENARLNGNRLKVACVHGHPYDEANTYTNPNTGHRCCRQCAREQRMARGLR